MGLPNPDSLLLILNPVRIWVLLFNQVIFKKEMKGFSLNFSRIDFRKCSLVFNFQKGRKFILEVPVINMKIMRKKNILSILKTTEEEE